MAFVPVPKDLSTVKTKVALNLTKRQIICFLAAGIVGIPVYFLTKGAIGNSAAVIVMIIMMLPLFFLAMYEKDGQPAEMLMRNFIRVKVWPGTRPYATENLYKYLEEEAKNLAQQNAATGTAGAPFETKYSAGE